MSRRLAHLAALAAGLLVLGIGRQALAVYCPCYTASSAYNDHNCGIEAVPGTNPSDDEWLSIFNVVAQGPDVWGANGPSVSQIGQGCGHPEVMHNVSARFPCELIEAIAMHESGWKQFCVPDRPADEVGGQSRTIISFDCGYGVGQVTSGMHAGENPSFDRQRVAAEATYNMATGARILAGKWSATACVGDNQPRIIEDWYSATWAYNGLAYSNNPNNPNYDPGRGVWDPSVGGSCPYQERVFGRMEHTGGKWPATALAYPNPGEIGTGSSPPALSEPSCASPTDCNNTRPVHQTICDGSGGAGGSGGSGTGGTGTGGSGTGGTGLTGGAGGSGASHGQGGSTEGPNGIAGSDSGCSCGVGPGAAAGGARRPGLRALLGLLGLGALVARRRRRTG